MRRKLVRIGPWSAWFGLAVIPLVAIPSGELAGQEGRLLLEVRGSVLYSTPLAESQVLLIPTGQPATVTADTAKLELGGGLAPYLTVGVLRDFGERIWLEAQVGATWGQLTGEGPSGEWDAGSVTTLHALLGLRVGLDRGFYVRGGVGAVTFSASDEVAVFREGEDTGLLVAAGLGYQPLGDLPLNVEVEAQHHEFGTPALRRVGGQDGAVQRYLVSVSYQIELLGGRR